MILKIPESLRAQYDHKIAEARVRIAKDLGLIDKNKIVGEFGNEK